MFSNAKLLFLGFLTCALRTSIMETSIFEYLNESYTYTPLIYTNFSIVVPSKHSISPTQISHKVLK